MKLAVDARELCGKPTGKGQYLRKILAALFESSAFQEECEAVDLFVKEDQKADQYLLDLCATFDRVHIVSTRGRSIAWHVRMTALAASRGATVLFSATSYLPALFSRVPVVMVVHDLAVFFGKDFVHDKKAQFIEKATLQKALIRAKKVVAVSEATKSDIMRFQHGIQNISVVPCAPVVFRGQPTLSLEKRSGNILFVSTLQPRKGVAELLKAYSNLDASFRADHHLHLAGGAGWGGEDYEALATSLDIESTAHFLGYVSDADLADEYARASVLVYPSLYEGFGIPLVEAMAFGTPVITCNNSSLPEVVGSAGVVVETKDVTALTKAMHTVLSDTAEWQKLSDASRERAAHYTWKNSAETLFHILTTVS